MAEQHSLQPVIEKLDKFSFHLEDFFNLNRPLQKVEQGILLADCSELYDAILNLNSTGNQPNVEILEKVNQLDADLKSLKEKMQLALETVKDAAQKFESETTRLTRIDLTNRILNISGDTNGIRNSELNQNDIEAANDETTELPAASIIYELGDYNDLDSDNDSIGDLVERDLDSDNDSIADLVETDLDSNNDGISDILEPDLDSDNDTIGDIMDHRHSVGDDVSSDLINHTNEAEKEEVSFFFSPQKPIVKEEKTSSSKKSAEPEENAPFAPKTESSTEKKKAESQLKLDLEDEVQTQIKEEPKAEKAAPVEAEPKKEVTPPVSSFSIVKFLLNSGEGQQMINNLGMKPVDNIKSAMGLNSKFLFIRELFKNDHEFFSAEVDVLNDMPNLAAAESYIFNELIGKLAWDLELESVKEFLIVVYRRFVGK